MFNHRVGGVDASDLPILDLGRNLNLTAGDMADFRHQGTTVDNGNDPYTGNIPDQVKNQVIHLNKRYSERYNGPWRIHPVAWMLVLYGLLGRNL